MRNALLLFVPAFAIALVAAACNGSSSATDDADAGEGATVIPPDSIPSTTDSTQAGPAGTGLVTGLPCDVQGVIENRCIACHGPGGTETPLTTYDELVGKSAADPTKSRAEVALAMLKAKTMPPAPAVAPDADEIATFEAWVTQKTPQNKTACTDFLPGGDAGAPDGGADAGSRCTSGTLWTKGNQGSDLMHPGAACNACHQQNDGPNLRIAGTVYPSLHEPNDCNGSAPPPQIVVTVVDSRNRTFRMNVNQAGNFFTRSNVRPPLKVSISDGKQTVRMQGSVTSGDCNSCHTENGTNKAPGRIVAPPKP